MNTTTLQSVVFAGTVDEHGNCNRGTYSDHYGGWEYVTVDGYIEISLFEYNAKMKSNTDELHLRSQIVCKLSDTECQDIDGGNTYWNYVPLNDCKFDHYELLYTGYANKTKGETDGQKNLINSLETSQITFALKIQGGLRTCGPKIIRTEHRKLFIVETNVIEPLIKNKFNAYNLDFSAYLNSKFVYLEKIVQIKYENSV